MEKIVKAYRFPDDDVEGLTIQTTEINLTNGKVDY